MYIYDNKINKIPKQIDKLINLKILSISRNNYIKSEESNTESFDFFPKEICNLINLYELICSDNKLKELPIEIINCINLIILNYSDNEIIMNPIIQRFIDRQNNINNNRIYNNGQNIHTSSIQDSVKQSIINLLNDK